MELEALLERVEHAKTHYEALGLSHTANMLEIQQAHQHAVTLLHPSHGTTNRTLSALLMTRVDGALDRVSEAYSALSTLGARIEYDRSQERRPPTDRLRLCIAASVAGYDEGEGKWHEIARTVEVSRKGVSLRMRHGVARGCVLNLTLPLPVDLRNHGHSQTAYEVFAIVRRIEYVTDSVTDGGCLVEVEFIGPRPPVGYLSKPWGVFNISSPIDQ